MILRFRPEAKAEVETARAYLNAQSPGFGSRFIDEMAECFDRIVEMPLLYPLLRNYSGKMPVRRALLRYFPYAVIFAVFEHYILIIAVAHTSRKPEYWSGRIS